MAGIDRLYTKYYYDKLDLVVWCIKHKPSLISNIDYPFDSFADFKKCKEFLAKAKGIKLIPENEDAINSVKLSIATFTRKEDKYLYWHCPLDFVREYLEEQCGYKKANWFVKLFWKY